MPAKELYFVGASFENLRSFPEDARREAGHQLYLVQLGDDLMTGSQWLRLVPGVRDSNTHNARASGALSEQA